MSQNNIQDNMNKSFIKTKILLTQFSVKVLGSSSQTKVDEFLFRWEANFVAWVIITSM